MTDTNYLYEYFLKKTEDSQSNGQDNEDQSDDEQSQDKE